MIRPIRTRWWLLILVLLLPLLAACAGETAAPTPAPVAPVQKVTAGGLTYDPTAINLTELHITQVQVREKVDADLLSFSDGGVTSIAKVKAGTVLDVKALVDVTVPTLSLGGGERPQSFLFLVNYEGVDGWLNENVVLILTSPFELPRSTPIPEATPVEGAQPTLAGPPLVINGATFKPSSSKELNGQNVVLIFSRPDQNSPVIGLGRAGQPVRIIGVAEDGNPVVRTAQTVFVQNVWYLCEVNRADGHFEGYAWETYMRFN